MPVPSLPPFFTFRPDNFHIGGSVSTLMAAAVRWRTFGDSALEAASAMRSINDGGFEGSEGDRFRELVNGDFPSNLQVTGDAHVGVADAISRYATLLGEHKSAMATLELTARGSHAAVNTAVSNVNAAEIALAAAPDPASKSAAAATLAAAMAEYEAALAVWEGNLASAQGIRTALGADAEAQAATIDTQSRKAFKDNPKPWEAAWDAVSDWLNEHGDILSFIADALQIVGAIAMFICPVVGAVLIGIGVGLKGLLAAAGVVSWGEFAFDLATAGPLGVLGKAVKAGKLGTTAAKGLNKASSVSTKALSSVKSAASSAASKAALKTAGGVNRVGSEKMAKGFYRTVTRGKEVCFKLEPVDMATGNMVDFETDVFIDGILPLVLDRNANTNHELGRALGPRWVSTMDIRLEICADEVLMLSPDGALLTFPPAPTDGSEVRADGRPWLLSYADGAYRVRNIVAGLTYTFRLFDLDGDSEDTASPGVKDESPSLGGSYVAAIIPSGSLAETVDAGMEVGLSSVIHHTGASIEYTWDVASGHMVRMRRSDDTILDLEWDKAVGRVAHVYVSNPSTHPDEDPLRLISYAYDAYGQLIRVINSNDGALQYHYDEHGRMDAWTDRNGVSYFYRFDELGRVHSQVGTGGMFPNIVYWADDEGDDAPEGGRLCVAIETAGEFKGDPLELGNSVVDEYFARLEALPLYKALVEGGLTAAGMTGRGRTSSRDDESWTVPGAWLHDDFLGDIRPTVYRSTPAGDVWRIVTPEGGIQDTSYNEYHQKIAITNSADATTSHTFNEDGVLISTEYPGGLIESVEPGAWASPVRIVSTDGLATECEMDEFGMVSAVTTPAGETTSQIYDVRSSGIVPAATIRPDGTTTVIEADDAGRIIATTDAAGRRTSILRDVRGLPIETIDPAEACTRIEYTPEGWPARVTHPDGTQVSAVYDGEGNQVSSTSEIGAVTTSHFTVFDKLGATTDATGATTRLEYNTQMQPVRLTNADGNVWQYSYDLDGMVVCEIDYNGITTTNALSADGISSTITNPTGRSTLVRHADGRVDKIADALGTSTYFYDEFNRLTGIQGPQATIKFERDGYGRPIKETVTLASGESTAHALSIDATGNVASEHVTLPLGDAFTTTFKRDEAGEIAGTTHTRTLPGSELTEIVAEMRYRNDARGIRSQLSTGSVIRNFSRDVRGRTRADTLSLLDNSAEGGLRTVTSRMFTWRSDGALSMITDFLRGVTSFDLDAVGRVTRLNRIAHSGDNPVTESAGSLVEEHYGFTAAGVLNLINAPDPESASSTTGRSKSDCLVEFNGTMPTRVGRTTYMYDAAGRVIQTVTKRISKKPLTCRFFYGGGEQPIGFTRSDEPEIGYRYVYDPLGRRVAKERISSMTGRLITRTVFTHSGDQIIAEQVTHSSEADIYGNGRVWTADPDTGALTGQIKLSRKAMNAAGESRETRLSQPTALFELIMADLAGSPQELVNPDSGDITGTAEQTLYGLRTWNGESACPLLFMGQYADAESGWVYNRYRYYDPRAGVYNAQDPLGASGRISSAQGYVDHAAHWFDALGLKAHEVTADELRAAGVPESKIAMTQEWLNKNPSSREVTLYSAHHKDGSMEYVGQTNDFERRQGEHGERFGNRLRKARINTKELSEGAEMFTPHQARALEQSAIVEHRMLKEGGTLVNARNEIAPGRDIHDNVVLWAKHMRAKDAVKFIS